VAGLDEFGNPGAFSNEASVLVIDSVPPLSPSIFFPTRPGRPIEVSDPTTAVIGFAEPGVAVELTRNGVAAGTVQSRLD
jgi:hypothetical protein